MNITRTLAACCALASALAYGADGGKVTEAIAFHGFLDDGSGNKAGKLVTLDFKLYSGEDADAELLWARRIPVTLDAQGGFYLDIADAEGRRYQATDGRTASCGTLTEALARHGQLSSGPIWIAYEPVDAKVATPPPREPLYYQPAAQRAARAKHVELAEVASLDAGKVTAEAPVAVDRLVCRGEVMSMEDLRYVAPDRKVELNKSGSVRLGSLTGFTAASAVDGNGTMTNRLPAVADADCGRLVRRALASGKVTHEMLFYSAGQSTTPPADATTIYIWTFGKLEESK